MASGKLHSLSVERAHRFGGKVLLSDGDGLYFRKQTREGAAWMFRYRFAGRERRMTLGNFPDMSLATARIEAREKRLMLDKRRDPPFAKQEAEEAQRAALDAQKARQTFRDLAEDWYSTEIDPRRLKHPKVPRRYLRDYGEEHGFNHLTTKKWHAHEVDGWEMTSIAAFLLKARGAYRTPKDPGFTFMIMMDVHWAT